MWMNSGNSHTDFDMIVTIAVNRSHRIPQTCVYTQYPLTGQWLAV